MVRVAESPAQTAVTVGAAGAPAAAVGAGPLVGGGVGVGEALGTGVVGAVVGVQALGVVN